MPRRARFTVSDGIYHVMARGNNRANIFRDDEDFIFYLKQIKNNGHSDIIVDTKIAFHNEIK